MASLASDIPEDDDEMEDETTPLAASAPSGPLSARSPTEGLAATLSQRQDARRQRVREIYEAAEARLRAQPVGPSSQEKWLALAAALGRPTRTGTFGETIGNASTALLGHQQAVTKATRDREEALAQLQMDRAKTDLMGEDALDKLALQYLRPQRLVLNPVTGDAQDAYTGEIVKPGNSGDSSDVAKPTVVPGSDPRVGGDPKRNYIIYPKRMGKAPTLVEGQPSNEMETWTDPNTGKVYQRRKGSGEPYTEAPIVGRENEDPETEGRQLARVYGLPYQPPRVPAGLSKKARDAYLAKRANESQNRLSEIAEDARQSNSLVTMSDQFMAIAGKTKTGPEYTYMPAILRPADINQLEGIQQNLIPLQPRTPGAISNFEAVGLGKGTLSPFSSAQANITRYNRTKAYDQLNREYQDFIDTWSQVNGGSIDGADAVWQRYLRDQPIFDPKRADMAAPNTKRLSWKQWSQHTYYGKKRRPAPAKAAEPQIKIISVEPVR